MLYRLPDGKATPDVEEYGRKWGELMDRLQATLPEGYFADACDPNVRITKRRSNGNGTYTGLWSGLITVELAWHLIGTHEALVEQLKVKDR